MRAIDRLTKPSPVFPHVYRMSVALPAQLLRFAVPLNETRLRGMLVGENRDFEPAPASLRRIADPALVARLGVKLDRSYLIAELGGQGLCFEPWTVDKSRA